MILLLSSIEWKYRSSLESSVLVLMVSLSFDYGLEVLHLVLRGKPISKLQSVTCHQTQVNSPPTLTPTRRANTPGDSLLLGINVVSCFWSWSRPWLVVAVLFMVSMWSQVFDLRLDFDSTWSGMASHTGPYLAVQKAYHARHYKICLIVNTQY